MNTSFVSVIVPNYCHSKFLEQRMESILSQTYQNFEVIILDDCSPDAGASKIVIEKYRENPHVSKIVYNTENSGNTFKQWEKGINLAQGDLIWIAESDDYSDPRFLESMVQEFIWHKDCVLAYSTLIEVDTAGQILGEKRIFKDQHFSGMFYLKHYLALANFVRNASGAVFKKDAAMKVDKKYMNYLGAGDYLFWVEIARQGSVSIINKQYNYFRRHDSVVTAKRDADGSNFVAEKEILHHLNKVVRLSWFRKSLAYSYRAYRFKWTKFESDEIRNHLYELWKVKDYDKFISRITISILNRIYSKFNIFI